MIRLFPLLVAAVPGVALASTPQPDGFDLLDVMQLQDGEEEETTDSTSLNLVDNEKERNYDMEVSFRGRNDEEQEQRGEVEEDPGSRVVVGRVELGALLTLAVG